MVPNAKKPNNRFFNKTAEEVARITLPDRFKCRQCNQFKTPANYSNKEIKDYQFKKSHVPHINGITASLRCRPCAGEQVTELQCEGPCGKTKPLALFSKSQRTRGLKWCQECVLWKDSTEPGTIPTAAPGAELAPDEQYNDSWGYTTEPDIGIGSDSDSDAGNNFHFEPYRGMERLDLSDRGRNAASSTTAQSTAAVASSVSQSTLPHPRNTSVSMTGSAPSSGVTPSSVAYGAPAMRAGNRPSTGPNVRPEPAGQKLIDIDDGETVSSVSNPYEDAWSSTGTLGPWSAVDTRRRNALYTPQSTLPEPSRVLPAPAPAVPQLTRRHGWPKIAPRKPPQVAQPVAAQRRRQQSTHDSDGSPDEM